MNDINKTIRVIFESDELSLDGSILTDNEKEFLMLLFKSNINALRIMRKSKKM